MVEFGKQLAGSRHDPWAKAYLDYNARKAAIKKHGDPLNANDAELLAQIEDYILQIQIHIGKPPCRSAAIAIHLGSDQDQFIKLYI
jgi:hypothetical protein